MTQLEAQFIHLRIFVLPPATGLPGLRLPSSRLRTLPEASLGTSVSVEPPRSPQERPQRAPGQPESVQKPPKTVQETSKRAPGPRDGRESLPGRLPKALDEAKSARVQPAKPGRDPEETPRGTRRGFQEAHVFEMPKENHTSLTILPFRFRWAVKPQAANKAAADVPGGLSKNIWPTTTVLIFGMAPLVWR